MSKIVLLIIFVHSVMFGPKGLHRLPIPVSFSPELLFDHRFLVASASALWNESYRFRIRRCGCRSFLLVALKCSRQTKATDQVRNTASHYQSSLQFPYSDHLAPPREPHLDPGSPVNRNFRCLDWLIDGVIPVGTRLRMIQTLTRLNGYLLNVLASFLLDLRHDLLLLLDLGTVDARCWVMRFDSGKVSF